MNGQSQCSPHEERFAVIYTAGPDGIRGNGTRAYLEAYPSCRSEQAAAVGASRLLRRDKVRARMAELRSEASAEARARLRDWWELAPEAQETLRKAAAGELRFPDADQRLEPELIRSAVRAAGHILDRALGTVKQMHDHRVQGGIIVAVAGPSQMPTGELEPGPFGNGSGGYLPPA